ncbi:MULTISPECIES: hypothetical protein [Bacillus subtilis group]|uniref:hypothetical protein n=1 Tax=Bacillus subtilis group TaxID=653685 RepID=UPI001B9BB1C1|nr:hypothetical protein [Bacillus subtilis]MDN4185432.1 hypothetical protein [Bacillus subtilis]MEC3696401.1 hypothetical protein [Bacillus subtilis]CAF1914714.1 hypothetical protein NRS6194_04127 [Bacillus subtilis]
MEMIQIFVYDSDFIFDYPDVVPAESLPDNATTIQPPAYWRPQFHVDRQLWTEAASDEQIEEMRQQMRESVKE